MIDGWYTDEELALLAKACRAAPQGILVEIGVYRGKSARTMVNNAGERTVWLVDDMSLEGADQSTWPTGEHVFHVRRWTHIVIEPIAVLHQDAGHDYDTVLHHLLALGPDVAPGGMVCLHDFHSLTYPDVQRAWEVYLSTSGSVWDDFGQAGSLQVWRRR